MKEHNGEHFLSDDFLTVIWPRYELTLKRIHTRNCYLGYLRDICAYTMCDFTEIDPVSAQRYFSMLVGKQEYEAKTLHSRLTACRSVARYIEKNALFLGMEDYVNPFVSVALPDYTDAIKKEDIPSPKQMDAILSAAEEDIMMFTIITICFRCALTVSEICNLKVSSVLLDDAGRMCFVIRKGNISRNVKIPEDAATVLSSYVEEFPRAGYLFLNSRGTLLKPRTLQKTLKAIMDKAGLSRSFTFQDIRNASIIYMKQSGAPASAIVKYAGLSGEQWMHRYNGVLDDLDLAPCDYCHIKITR